MKSPMLMAAAAELLGEVFPGLSSQDYLLLVEACQIVEYPPDHILCREGQIEDTFYVVMSGKVEVSQALDRQERRVLKTMSRHGFFGEMALIRGEPRAATVRTLEPTTVVEIHQKAFETALYRSPVMAIAMLREVTTRLSYNDEMTIAELRQKNEQLAAAFEQLAEQERLRSEFLTTVSHELRTPLTSAKGYVQVMQSGMMDGPTLGAALTTVGHHLDVIVTLVNDILFLQEMEEIAPQYAPLDLGALLAEVVEPFRQRASAQGVSLIAEVAPGLPKIQGSAESLARVFRALVDNALKFSVRGGEVRIQASGRDGGLAVDVIDQGVGIAPEHLPKIFDRYFHVDEIEGHRFGGVGLGLAIAKHVVERHGGRIEVESTPGQGAAFRVTLPLNPT